MTELSGSIKKIIYQNEKNGYTVALFETSDDSDQIGIQTTITGNLPHVKADMPLTIKGNWTEHKVYGEQFSVESFHTIKPDNKQNLETFLLSGSIPGLNKKVCRRIIEECGDKFMDIIENNPNELLKIKGLGKKSLEKIIQTLRDQSDSVEIIAQLQDYGISPVLAKRILEHYKNKTLSVVLEDPFDLALTIQGIGFAKADEIAKKVGIDNLNEKRIVAGIIYALMDCYRFGHTYLNEEELVSSAKALLSVPEEEIKEYITEAVFTNRIYETMDGDKTIYYPIELYNAESEAALALYNLSKDKVNDDSINLDQLLKDVEIKLGLKLDESQKEAITTVTRNPITIITGGPGTGKSATRSIVK